MGEKKDQLNRIFGILNPFNFVKFSERVRVNFGTKFYLLLSSIYYGVKGAGYYFAKETLLPYTDHVGMQPQVYQLNLTISTVPWSIKGFVGVISDCFPLFGYYKTSYMILITLLGTVANLIMIVAPYSITQNFELFPAFVTFFIHLEASASDLLCEAKYVYKMRELPHTKGDVVTYIWFCQTFGQLIPAATVGSISQLIEPRYVYVISLPFIAQPLIFLFTGCMVDDKAAPQHVNRWNMETFRPQWKMMTFALVFGCGVLFTVVLSVITDNTGRLIYTLIFSGIMCAAAFYTMKNAIARGNLYIFLIRWLYISIQGPIDNFYIADPECVDGPQFSMIFYKTYTPLAASVCQFIGLYFFQVYVQHWNFRPAFWVTTVMRIIASIFDIILVLRWNTYVSIPDEVIHLIGNAVIVESVYMMDFMPMNLLIAKLCPKDVEATTYAVLAGFMNFGGSLGSYTGIFMADLFKIDGLPVSGDGTPCNYDNLAWLIFVCHFIAPLIAIPFTFILIPNAYVTDDLETIENSFSKMKLSKKQELVISDTFKNDNNFSKSEVTV